MKSLKFSDYIEIRKQEYVTIQITSHKSIRNYNSTNIAKAIAHSYKALNNKLRIEQKKLIIETNFTIKYVVDIKKEDVKFYFIVPKFFQNILLEKINEIWSKATVTLAEIEPLNTENVEHYGLTYRKDDALSLNVDRTSNEPLNSLLNVIDILKDDDRVTLVYNFCPANQIAWQDTYKETMEKHKKKKSLVKNTMTASCIIRNGFLFVVGFLDMLMEIVNEILGGKKQDLQESVYQSILTVLERQEELSTATKRKKDLPIIPTQIGLVSYSKDNIRRYNNIISVCQSFRSIDEDNELISSKVKPFNLASNVISKANLMSSDELQNLLQIPGRTLLNQFNINYIKTEECGVPEELREGYICLGTNTCKGIETKAYLQDHKEIGSLPLGIFARQGGGKTVFLSNYANNCKERNEAILHIDFIKECESSKCIEKAIKDNVILLDFSTETGLQAFAYNEIQYSNDMTSFQRQEWANKKSELTIQLIDAINDNGEPLSPKMSRYLSAACNVAYLSENATLKEVIRCLQDYQYRENIINSIPVEIKLDLEEEILALEELDEWSKATKDNPSIKCGTRESKIEGILDRVSLLLRDFYLKKMYKKNPKDNINFAKAIEEGKVILVRMPQSKFKSYVKNVITTFLLTKVWLGSEMKSGSNRIHVIIDEISQTPTAEKFMESILTQTRKFQLKFVITGQYLDQLNKKTIYSLKGAGTSFMLLKGAIQEDFEYLKEEIGDNFSYEDIQEMQEFSSLNIIQTNNRVYSFITKLPKPL